MNKNIILRYSITICLILFYNLSFGQVDFTITPSYHFNTSKTNFLDDLDSFFDRNRGRLTVVHVVHRPDKRLLSTNMGLRASILFKENHEIYVSFNQLKTGQRSGLDTLPIIRFGQQDFGQYETFYKNSSTSVGLGYSFSFDVNNKFKFRIGQDFLFNLYKESTYYYTYTPDKEEILEQPPVQAYFTRFKMDYISNALKYDLYRYGTSTSLDMIITNIKPWLRPVVGLNFAYFGRLRTDDKAFLSFLPDGTINVLSLKVGVEFKI